MPLNSALLANQQSVPAQQPNQSVFNRVYNTSAVSRENAFSASGQKVVHFKDTTSLENHQISDEQRKSQVRSALVKDMATYKTASGAGAQ